jgi:Nucleotidyl transferase AbiEii toxin, Type IV TA system
MNFKYPFHHQIFQVLQCLDRTFLDRCHIAFGGGTLLALAYGEYRLSRNIDFLCPHGEPFSMLRRAIYDRGYAVLFQPDLPSNIQFPHEIRTDRDGVRLTIKIDETILKLEIVAEGRIKLDLPEVRSGFPVSCLSETDQIAEKLLANGDRWADTSTDSRDLIDLAMLIQSINFSEVAINKAEAAYRCIDPLKRSIVNFQSKPDYRSRCYSRLQITRPNKIMNGIDALSLWCELEQDDDVQSTLGRRLSIER